jgi:hypothetical protein
MEEAHGKCGVVECGVWSVAWRSGGVEEWRSGGGAWVGILELF